MCTRVYFTLPPKLHSLHHARIYAKHIHFMRNSIYIHHTAEKDHKLNIYCICWKGTASVYLIQFRVFDKLILRIHCMHGLWHSQEHFHIRPAWDCVRNMFKCPNNQLPERPGSRLGKLATITRVCLGKQIPIISRQTTSIDWNEWLLTDIILSSNNIYVLKYA